MHARALRALIGAVALLAATAAPAAAAPQPIEKDAATCLAGGGVWVIVDTGQKVIAADCAEKPADGLDALAKVGAKTQSGANGMVCAILDEPKDMCAKNGFDAATGSYWSYWSRSGADADWEFSQKAANQTKPAPGSVEGWRWGNGEPSQTPKMANERVATAPDAASPQEGPWAMIGVGALVALLIAAFVVVRLRARSRGAGQDDAASDD